MKRMLAALLGLAFLAPVHAAPARLEPMLEGLDCPDARESCLSYASGRAIDRWNEVREKGRMPYRGVGMTVGAATGVAATGAAIWYAPILGFLVVLQPKSALGLVMGGALAGDAIGRAASAPAGWSYLRMSSKEAADRVAGDLGLAASLRGFVHSDPDLQAKVRSHADRAVRLAGGDVDLLKSCTLCLRRDDAREAFQVEIDALRAVLETLPPPPALVSRQTYPGSHSGTGTSVVESTGSGTGSSSRQLLGFHP